MASNLNVAITGDATQMRAALALAQADLRQYGTEVRKIAQEMRASGQTQSTELDRLSTLWNNAKADVARYSAATAASLGQASAAIRGSRAAVEEHTSALHNNGIQREAMVLAHEAMQGQFTSFGGSMMVMAERIGHASLAVKALVASFALATLAATHLIEKLRELNAAKLSAEAGGIGSGIPQKDIDAQVAALARLDGVTAEVAGKAIHAFASMRGVSQPVLAELSADVRNLALRLGEEIPSAATKVVQAWNLEAKAGADLLESIRTSEATVRAFTKAADDNKPLEARRILLTEIARAAREVQTQTRLATQENSGQSFMTARMDQVMRNSNQTTRTPLQQGLIDAARVQDDTTAAQRLAAALAAVNAEVKAPPAQTWSQRMGDELAQVTLTTVKAGRDQKKSWEDIHLAELEATTGFWRQQVATTAEGSKNRLEAERKYLDAQRQLEEERARRSDAGGKKSYEAEVARLDAEISANRQNFAMVVALEQQKLAVIRQARGAASQEYQAGIKSADETMARSFGEQIQTLERNAKRELEIKRAGLDEQLALGQISKTEEAAQLLAFVRQQQATEMAALNDAIALLDEGTTARTEALRQRAKLEQDFQAVLARLRAQEVRDAQQSAQQQAQAYMQAFSSVEGSFKSAAAGLAMGTTTWAKATQSVLQSVAGGFVDLGMKLLGNWIATQVAMTMTTAAQSQIRNAIQMGQSGLGALATHILGEWLGIETAKTGISAAADAVRSGEKVAAEAAATATGAATRVAEVEGLAAVAGAAAFASTAAIPIIGPELAPGAAAAAYAATMGFAPLAAAAQGVWNLPKDMPMQLHAGEMVVPQRFAQGLRQNIGSVAGGVFGGSAARAQGTHGGENHLHIHAHDTQTGMDFVLRNMPLIARGVSRMFQHNPSLRPAY